MSVNLVSIQGCGSNNHNVIALAIQDLQDIAYDRLAHMVSGLIVLCSLAGGLIVVYNLEGFKPQFPDFIPCSHVCKYV